MSPRAHVAASFPYDLLQMRLRHASGVDQAFQWRFFYVDKYVRVSLAR